MEIWISDYKKMIEVIPGGYSMGFVRPAKKMVYEQANGIINGSRMIYFTIKRNISSKSITSVSIDDISFPRIYSKKRVKNFDSLQQMQKYILENNFFEVC